MTYSVCLCEIYVFATQLYVSLVPNTASSEGIIQPVALPHVSNHVSKNSKFYYQLITLSVKVLRTYSFFYTMTIAFSYL